jgi:DEAD/DEAH box helicase domain-containing protein
MSYPTLTIYLLLMQDVVEVTKDGAPSGRKDFLVWNPPYVEASARQLGRQSSLAEATGLMRFLMKRGVRVILFCKVGFVYVCASISSR